MKFLRTYLCTVFFVLISFISTAQKKTEKKPAATAVSIDKNLTDEQLLDLVQKQTFRYFWDYGHPVSGLSRESSDENWEDHDQTVTIGGSGFGVMSIIVAAERKWITREQAVERLLKMINFLRKADHYHGMFPHWMNGATGKTIPFSRKDDGGDIVETSYLLAGLLCARQYFNGDNDKERALRDRINWTWNEAEWSWYTKDGSNVLFWHWSPNNGWSMNHEIRGWNECLITYLLAASSPQYPIGPGVYHNGWVNGFAFRNDREFYGIKLPLGPDYGGPLFFAHYSFLGLDPRGLKDRYADYWEQNKNHTLINREHCIRNPKNFKGYSAHCWGLTASLTPDGYSAHSPDNDLGTITPTAALSSFPYTPEFSMEALRYFYFTLGNKIWSQYGFVDAFNETKSWYANSHLAIDQGPIIIMIENYRTGLLWKLFMSCPEIQNGLKNLGFESPQIKQP
jgi:hypothetical protein